MAKDILKEAIADAKAVREVALSNAKAALEEAFTPKLQNMLSAKLSEELDENGDLAEMNYGEDEVGEDSMDEMDYGEDEVGEDSMDEEVNLDEEIDLEEILNELELEEADKADDKETVDEAKEDNDDKVDEAKKDDDKDEVKEAKEDDDDKVDEAKDDKDKEELDEQKPIYKAEYANDPSYKADHVNEEKDFDLDALLEEINNLDEKKDDDDEKLSEMDYGEESEDTNEAIGVGLAGIAGLIAAAGGMAKLKMMFQDPEMQAKYPTATKVLDALEDAGSAAGDAMRRENDEMAEELAETQKALKTITGELNEVNLLNSKLLYVNRIFKANTLDEVQKLRVVESLDKAGSAKEAKLIYETIKDTFNISKNIKKNPKRTSMKEGLGMASRAAGTSTAPKKEVISESNGMINRFQKLANIKINQ